MRKSTAVKHLPVPVPVQQAKVEVELCVPDDQLSFLPEHRAAPFMLPANVPVPHKGEVIYISSTSAWGVMMVIHEWRSPLDLRIEVWIEWVGSVRQERPDECRLTH